MKEELELGPFAMNLVLDLKSVADEADPDLTVPELPDDSDLMVPDLESIGEDMDPDLTVPELPDNEPSIRLGDEQTVVPSFEFHGSSGLESDDDSDVGSDASVDSTPVDEQIDAIDVFRDRLKVTGGFTGKQISEALYMTGLNRNLAEIVLEAQKRGKPLPDVDGVWSRQDDEVLMGSDSKAMEALTSKRNKQDWEKRLKFLQDWNDSGIRKKAKRAV